MAYKNIKELLTDATKLPVAIEAKLPEGAPKISEMLTDAADKIPAIPDFPVEIPVLPEVPELPEMPGAPELARTRVTPRPVFAGPTIEREIIPSPAVGLIPEVITRRGI